MLSPIFAAKKTPFVIFVPLYGKLPFRCHISRLSWRLSMTKRRVYLDHSATTPVDPRVANAMVRAVTETFGNASSVHGFGQQARAAIDRARREVATLIGAKQNEIVFTSGGTEANNLAIRGLCEASAAHGRHVITSAIEHPSVAGVCAQLEKQGWEVTRLPVYANGLVRIEDV